MLSNRIPRRICPSCQFDAPEGRGRFPDRVLETTQEFFEWGRCPRCGLHYLLELPADPRPSYPPEYWGFQGENQRGLQAAYRRWCLRERISFFRPLPQGTVILEIGGGDGATAQILQKAGWPVWTIEADPRAAAQCRARGISRVHVGAADEAWPADWPWSEVKAVAVFHVLEHLSVPGRLMENLQRHLRPPIQIVIQLPNLDSWQAHWFGARWLALDIPRHVNHFSRASLTHFLQSRGIEVEQWRHYSRRDSASTWVSSLALSLDLKRQRIRGAGYFKGNAIALLHLILSWIIRPLCGLEALAKKGAILTAIATWRDSAEPGENSR